MIFSIFASLFSPATTTTTMEYAPSPLSSTPLSSCSHVLSTTTLSFDPMEVDYITMPPGTKRKLNQLYQSMGELPIKGPKTEPVFKNKELLAATKFEKKQQLQTMTSLLAKETSMKSLFFRRKNNSFSFDFVVLASNLVILTKRAEGKKPELRDNQIGTNSFNKSQTLPKKKQETSKSDLKITKNRSVVKNRHDRKVRPLRTAPELTADKVTSFSKKTISLIKRNQNLNKEDEVSKLFTKLVVDDQLADGADFVAFS
ncbi:hypothetical protein KCU78_g5380, partial [Aureobasidium melanogenum]